MTDQASSAGGNWAVLLVHGIGTSKPMQMIESVGAALKTQRPELDLDVPIEAHPVQTGAVQPMQSGKGTADDDDALPAIAPPTEAKRNVETQGGKYVFMRNGKLADGRRVRFAEAYWGDVSFYKPGLLNLIGALLISSFGVRFFAEAATNTRTTLGWMLKWVLNYIVFVVAAVAFPLTFVTLIYSGMGLLAESTLKYQVARFQDVFIIVLGLLFCVPIGWAGLRRVSGMSSYRTLGPWIFGAIIFFAVLFAALIFIGGRFDRNWMFVTDLPQEGWVFVFLRDNMLLLGDWFGYHQLVERVDILDRIGVYFAFMHCLQLVVGIILIGLTSIALILLFLNLTFQNLTTGLSRGVILATVSVMSIWIINLIVLWPENLITSAAMSSYLDNNAGKELRLKNGVPDKAGGLTKKDQTIDLKVFYWGDLIDRKVPLLSPEEGGVLEDEKKKYLKSYYPILWFEALFMGFLIAVSILVVLLVVSRLIWVAGWRQAKSYKSFEPPEGKVRPKKENWPRLVVSAPYKVFVLLLTLLICLFLFVLLGLAGFAGLAELGVFQEGSRLLEWKPYHEFAIASEWIKISVIGFVLFFMLFAHYIRDAMKLMLDIVNHFTAPDKNYPVRRKIAARFKNALNALMEESVKGGVASGKKPNLVVIAHSQGTVITYDQLNKGGFLDKVKDKVASLTVVTFGSPVTNIYQRYFEAIYPPIKTKFVPVGVGAAGVDQTVLPDNVRWFNVYRIDDYVGTYIENSVQDFPKNIALGPGGHIRYWEEGVFERVFGDDGPLKDVVR